VRTLMAGNVGYSIVIGRPEIALTGEQLFHFLKLEMTCNDCNDGRARGNNFQSPTTQSRGNGTAVGSFRPGKSRYNFIYDDNIITVTEGTTIRANCKWTEVVDGRPKVF